MGSEPVVRPEELNFDDDFGFEKVGKTENERLEELINAEVEDDFMNIMTKSQVEKKLSPLGLQWEDFEKRLRKVTGKDAASCQQSDLNNIFIAMLEEAQNKKVSDLAKSFQAKFDEEIDIDSKIDQLP